MTTAREIAQLPVLYRECTWIDVPALIEAAIIKAQAEARREACNVIADLADEALNSYGSISVQQIRALTDEQLRKP